MTLPASVVGVWTAAKFTVGSLVKNFAHTALAPVNDRSIAVARYISIREPAKSSWWEATPQPLPHPQLWLPEPVDTKLLDADGNKILRMPDQIGFFRSK